MALVSTSRVRSSTAPDGSNPVILPSVCSAITRLICVRASSGAPAKSASATAAAAASRSRAVKAGCNGRPACTQTVAGARNVTAPSAVTSLTSAASARSPSAAASGEPPRCRAPASSAAVWPRAPHNAIRSAAATLTGENTVSAARSDRTRYRSVPNASSAIAGTAVAEPGWSCIVARLLVPIRSHPSREANAAASGLSPCRWRGARGPGERSRAGRAGRRPARAPRPWRWHLTSGAGTLPLALAPHPSRNSPAYSRHWKFMRRIWLIRRIWATM